MIENYLNLIPEQYRIDVLEYIECTTDNVHVQCDILLYIISMYKENEKYLIEKGWKDNKYCIKADDYLEEKEIQEEQDRFIECPFKIGDLSNENGSDEKCRKCGSKKVFTMSYQNRSGDEAMSSYLICHCGHKELRSG